MSFRPPAFSTWVYPISLRISFACPDWRPALIHFHGVVFIRNGGGNALFHFLQGNIDGSLNVLLLILLWNTNIDPVFRAKTGSENTSVRASKPFLNM